MQLFFGHEALAQRVVHPLFNQMKKFPRKTWNMQMASGSNYRVFFMMYGGRSTHDSFHVEFGFLGDVLEMPLVKHSEHVESALTKDEFKAFQKNEVKRQFNRHNYVVVKEEDNCIYSGWSFRKNKLIDYLTYNYSDEVLYLTWRGYKARSHPIKNYVYHIQMDTIINGQYKVYVDAVMSKRGYRYFKKFLKSMDTGKDYQIQPFNFAFIDSVGVKEIATKNAQYTNRGEPDRLRCMDRSDIAKELDEFFSPAVDSMLNNFDFEGVSKVYIKKNLEELIRTYSEYKDSLYAYLNSYRGTTWGDLERLQKDLFNYAIPTEEYLNYKYRLGGTNRLDSIEALKRLSHFDNQTIEGHFNRVYTERLWESNDSCQGVSFSRIQMGVEKRLKRQIAYDLGYNLDKRQAEVQHLQINDLLACYVVVPESGNHSFLVNYTLFENVWQRRIDTLSRDIGRSLILSKPSQNETIYYQIDNRFTFVMPIAGGLAIREIDLFEDWINRPAVVLNAQDNKSLIELYETLEMDSTLSKSKALGFDQLYEPMERKYNYHFSYEQLNSADLAIKHCAQYDLNQDGTIELVAFAFKGGEQVYGRVISLAEKGFVDWSKEEMSVGLEELPIWHNLKLITQMGN